MNPIDLNEYRIGHKIKELGRAAQRAGRLEALHQYLEGEEMQEKYVYTVKEVAELLGVTAHSVRRWINAGDLDAAKIGRSYRVDRPALEDFWRARGGTSLFNSDEDE